MDLLLLLRVLLDFGLLVLIWLVQLIIYPSLCSYSNNEALWSWHSVYMKRISFLVIPLMIGQVILCVLQIIEIVSFYTLASVVLVIAIWLLTFTIFVPLHSRIVAKKEMQKAAKSLVFNNWWRTVVWSLLFVLSLFDLLQRV